jgi:hypothetical protein
MPVSLAWSPPFRLGVQKATGLGVAKQEVFLISNFAAHQGFFKLGIQALPVP